MRTLSASQKFKDTPAGSIPVDWQSIPLREIISAMTSGVSVNGEAVQISAGEVGVLKVSAVSDGSFYQNEHKRVVEKDRSRVSMPVRAGSVLVSRSNTGDLVRETAFIEKDYPQLFLSDKLWEITVDPDHVDSRWLSYLLNSPSFRAEVSRRCSGTSGSMKNISQPSYTSIPVPFPPLVEQRAIAERLSGWDAGIRLSGDLLDLKVAQKRGLMQQLLTGKFRFKEFVKKRGTSHTRFAEYPNDWPLLPIGDFAREVIIRNGHDSEIPVLSCTKHAGLVESLKYFGKQVFSDDKSNYRVVRRGHFAYATNHIEEGSIGYQGLFDAALISPIYTVFETDERVHHGFLYRVLKSDLYRHIFEINTNSSVDRRGSLRWEDFSKITVALPCYEEQSRIADVFQASDDEIDVLSQQADALREQKGQLMHELLTGQIRLRAA